MAPPQAPVEPPVLPPPARNQLTLEYVASKIDTMSSELHDTFANTNEDLRKADAARYKKVMDDAQTTANTLRQLERISREQTRAVQTRIGHLEHRLEGEAGLNATAIKELRLEMSTATFLLM